MAAAYVRRLGLLLTWQSTLQLSFDSIAPRQKTRLFHRLHSGALMVQRPLYPEPETVQQTHSSTLKDLTKKQQSGICHVYVLYPPAGIADGDKLSLNFDLKSNSHAVITTPGAGKWYGQRQSIRDSVAPDPTKLTEPMRTEHMPVKSRAVETTPIASSVQAEQHITATLDDNAILEWLPQESIYFDYSVSHACNRFFLAPTASLITWDIAVFGRQAYNETFTHGQYNNRLEVWRDKSLLISENTQHQAASRWFKSPLGLNNQHVHGSLWAVPSKNVISTVQQSNPLKLGQYLDETLSELRKLMDEHNLPIECTHNYQAINCRYLGLDVRTCFEAFYQVRELLRKKWYQLEPHRPRIWDT